MGQIVFNYKTCDHEKWCPAKTACEQQMSTGENMAAIFYDAKEKKIKVNGKLCASFNCKEAPCTRQCQYFKYAFTDAEKWLFEQEVSQFKEDPQYYFIPRFDAGGCPDHVGIDYQSLIQLIANNSSLLFVEITNARSSVSIFEAVEYSELMPMEIYNCYYKKLFILDANTLEKAEETFLFYELPVLLVFNRNLCVDRITGICKKNEVEKISALRDRIQSHISKILF